MILTSSGRFSFLLSLLLGTSALLSAQPARPVEVIAYCGGNATNIEQYPLEDLTEIIYSFLHLKGNQLSFSSDMQKTTLLGLTNLKKQYPHLRVLVSLGGWGGCASCSEVFSSKNGRSEFVRSVKAILEEYNADGIDLDWEYPSIEGFPGHAYSPNDKANFTALVKQLRKKLGKHKEISFAAGGFTRYLEEAVNWKKVMRYVDRVNLMTYDLVSGNSTVTGHHTPLYSTGTQTESTNHCVQALIKKGVSPEKLIIGAAFYSRTWKNVADQNHGLYQSGQFKSFIPYRIASDTLTDNNGYLLYYDDTAKASYRYNAEKNEFATFDDEKSVMLKTKYVLEHKLGGIMFWELTLDKPSGGLLDVIARTLQESKAPKP